MATPAFYVGARVLQRGLHACKEEELSPTELSSPLTSPLLSSGCVSVLILSERLSNTHRCVERKAGDACPVSLISTIKPDLKDKMNNQLYNYSLKTKPCEGSAGYSMCFRGRKQIGVALCSGFAAELGSLQHIHSWPLLWGCNWTLLVNPPWQCSGWIFRMTLIIGSSIFIALKKNQKPTNRTNGPSHANIAWRIGAAEVAFWPYFLKG